MPLPIVAPLLNPTILQVIAFRTIFLHVLRKWNFNLPTTFFVLSSLKGVVPDHLIEEMFSLIEATNGSITQTIHLYSYDPTLLQECLSNMITITDHVCYELRPIEFVRKRVKTYLFADCLKSVRTHIASHINFCLKNVLCGVMHSVELKFDKLTFRNDKYVLNHKHMKEIVFNFPKNFDLPKFVPSLYTSLKDARENNIQPQPRFIDDLFHIKPSNKNCLFMSFTFSCPSCHGNTFNYNCLTQKLVNKTFDYHKTIRKVICECISCTNVEYRAIDFP